MPSTPTTYAQTDPTSKPGYMSGTQWQAFWRALGSVRDKYGDRGRQAVACYDPTRMPGDGLAYIGLDRHIPRGVAESDAAYRTRLANAWATWNQAGGGTNVVTILAATGYLGSVIGTQPVGMMFSINPATGNPLVSQQPNKQWNPAPGATGAWQYSYLMTHPFPSWWGTNGFAPVIHMPAVGAGVVTPSGTPLTDPGEIWLTVTTPGATGTAVFSWAAYQYANYVTPVASGSVNSNAVAQAIGSTGVSVACSGSFSLNDVYAISLAASASNGADAPLIKSVLSTFVAGHLQRTRTTVMLTGPVFGWPIQAFGSTLPTYFGLSSTTDWGA